MRSDIALPVEPVFECEHDVMFFDTDVGGVVHNLAYLRMIEVCRTRLAECLGMPLATMAEDAIYPVVVRTEIDYRAPGKLGDILVTTGRLDKLERSRFWVAFEMRRKTDDALLITCRQMLAVVQMPEGRPQRVPKVWREKYPQLSA